MKVYIAYSEICKGSYEIKIGNRNRRKFIRFGRTIYNIWDNAKFDAFKIIFFNLILFFIEHIIRDVV